MRAFEFHEGEVVHDPGKRIIVDLDYVVKFEEEPTSWGVWFSGAGSVFLTKPAFDRILLAWKSK